jgi:hypothetical protein
VPDERLGSLEIGGLGRWARKPLQGGGQALEALRQGGFVVHHRLAIFRASERFLLAVAGRLLL